MISRTVNDNLKNSSWIRAMFEEGGKLRKIYGAENVYDFSIGNPDPEPPEQVRQAFIKHASSTEKGTHSYMSNAGYPELREKIAEKYRKTSTLPFTASNVIITCGAAGGLNVALKTLLDPGDEVIIFKPFFAEYIFYVKNAGGTPVFVSVNTETFQPDPTQLEAAITSRTKAVIINSPNNPTGAVYTSETLSEIAAVLKKKEAEFGNAIYILSDEPYRELVYDGCQVPDLFSIFRNAITIYSFSKSLSLPGERIGYIISSPEMDSAAAFTEGAVFCNRTLGFVNAPAFIQRVLADSLDCLVDPDIYRERRDILYNGIVSLGFNCVKPSGAFYLFPESPVADDVEFVKAALKYNLLLVPGRGFGFPGYFRMAYCIDKKTITGSIPQFAKLAGDFGLAEK